MLEKCWLLAEVRVLFFSNSPPIFTGFGQKSLISCLIWCQKALNCVELKSTLGDLPMYHKNKFFHHWHSLYFSSTWCEVWFFKWTYCNSYMSYMQFFVLNLKKINSQRINIYITQKTQIVNLLKFTEFPKKLQILYIH